MQGKLPRSQSTASVRSGGGDRSRSRSVERTSGNLRREKSQSRSREASVERVSLSEVEQRYQANRAQAMGFAPPARSRPGTGASFGANNGKRVLRGPEKFFYDSRTYTGTAKQGGHTTLGSGASGSGASGYTDLKHLCNRGHVQDD